MKYQEYKLEIISLILLASILVLIVFIIKPLWSKIQLDVNETQAILLDQEKNQQLLSKMSSLRKQNKLIAENKPMLEVFFDKEEALKLAEQIESIAQQTNNKIIIKADKVADKPKKSTRKVVKSKEQEKTIDPALDNYLSVTIKLAGKRDDILRFIKKINILPYLFSVISLNITQEEDRDFFEENKLSQPITDSVTISSGNYFKNIKQNNSSSANNSNEEEMKDDIYYAKIKIFFYTQDNFKKK